MKKLKKSFFDLGLEHSNRIMAVKLGLIKFVDFNNYLNRSIKKQYRSKKCQSQY